MTCVVSACHDRSQSALFVSSWYVIYEDICKSNSFTDFCLPDWDMTRRVRNESIFLPNLPPAALSLVHAPPAPCRRFLASCACLPLLAGRAFLLRPPVSASSWPSIVRSQNKIESQEWILPSLRQIKKNLSWSYLSLPQQIDIIFYHRNPHYSTARDAEWYILAPMSAGI